MPQAYAKNYRGGCGVIDLRIKAKRLRQSRVAQWLAKPQARDTPTPCSCWMCGNPRKWFGNATVQECSFAQTEEWQ